jgi:hypothetical protein
MDKKIFLLDKDFYSREMVENLTENELEDWAAAEDSYDVDLGIVKIDANKYDSVKEALDNELLFSDIDDYFVFSFGF